MHPNLRPFHSFRLFLLPAVLFTLAGHARAGTLAAPTAELATVRITGSALEPDRLAVGHGQHLVFRNEGTTMARVELDLEHGTGILCRNGVDEVRGRKFVVASGDALECEAPPQATRYHVYRARAGGGTPVATEGELSPAK